MTLELIVSEEKFTYHTGFAALRSSSCYAGTLFRQG